jgi:hypothetical protein
MKRILQSAVVLLFIALLPSAPAEEKNGLLVNVTKRTLNRSDRRDSLYYTRYDRTQGFKLAIKGTAPRPFPEGEVTWTILVKKMYYTDRVEKYTGTEKLKALRPSESVDLMVGAVPIQGYRYERDYKDEMEYDIAITHAGKETMRLTSTSNFAALGKRAVHMKTEEEPEAESSKPTRSTRSTPPATPPPTNVPVTPAPGYVRPSTPPTAVPATPPAPAYTPPAAPAATVKPKPADPATPPPAEGEAKPFDFFNLDKKKAPESK